MRARALQLQAEQHQAGAVIKKLFYILVALAVTLLIGCSASRDVWTDENDQESIAETSPEEMSDNTQQSKEETGPGNNDTSQQRFNVQADTLSVHSRKKTNGEPAAISMRAAAPTKYYSVQIGAYTKKINADRNYTITQKRFKLPMIRLYEGGIKMERICTGRFPTKKAAEDFLKKIQEQYPKDYTEAWVVMFKKLYNTPSLF